MAIIEIKGVAKTFGAFTALHSVDLTIADREFMVLLGASGCGKTTLLRIIAGLETPTTGEVWIGGRRVDHLPPRERGIAMVFQNYAVFPHLTVLGNVMLGKELKASRFAARLFGAAKREVQDEARTMIAAVGLAGSEDKYPAQLSGGMQQRLALAQALIMRPKVLLLDEPFGALDPGIRAEIHTLMKKLWHEAPMTVVMVTHDMREAFTLATRVVAFERPRDRPEEKLRYGATITRDIAIWPPRKAGEASLFRPDRDGPVSSQGQ
jgi:NitT/TauT family transport system ATP-binding protein